MVLLRCSCILSICSGRPMDDANGRSSLLVLACARVPELPDISLYLAALTARVKGQALQGVRLASPFLVRTVTPPLKDTFGRQVVGLIRLGKRIVFCLEGDLY